MSRLVESDVELGVMQAGEQLENDDQFIRGSPQDLQSQDQNKKIWPAFSSFLRSRRRNTIKQEVIARVPVVQVEDYKLGYPQFSALIGAHAPFNICRRFRTTRARLLLLKQDNVSCLEQELQRIDQEENSPIFLGNCRRDSNSRRKETLESLNKALMEYDSFVERSSRILSLKPPHLTDVVSLRNWVESTACIARTETEFLDKEGDLLGMGTLNDDTLKDVEVIIQRLAVSFYQRFRMHPEYTKTFSRDPTIYAISPISLRRIARALIGCLTVLILLIPVIVVNYVASMGHRMIAIIVASVIVLVVLSNVTQGSTWEMFIGAATYAAVLVVFISGNNTVGMQSAQCVC